MADFILVAQSFHKNAAIAEVLNKRAKDDRVIVVTNKEDDSKWEVFFERVCKCSVYQFSLSEELPKTLEEASKKLKDFHPTQFTLNQECVFLYDPE
jgi:hypothetical protein